MIIEFKQPRLYVCSFVHNGQIESVKFKPGTNKVDNKFKESLLKHPGIKSRLDLGILSFSISKEAIDVDKAAAEPIKKDKDKDKDKDKKEERKNKDK